MSEAQPDEHVDTERASGVAAAMARVRDIVRRCPLTSATVAALVITAIVTAAAWRPAPSTLLDTVGYGLPALREGRVWTFVAGMFYAPEPWMVLSIAAVVAVFGGALEWRAGTWRTGVVLFGTQLAATVTAALLLWLLEGHGWRWVDLTAGKFDVGLSAGAMGCAGALSAFLGRDWRLRLRIVLMTYLVVMVLYVGLLWDLEHLLAAVMGLAIGPAIADRRPLPLQKPRTTKREIRLGLAFFVAASAFVHVLALAAPGDGGVLSVRPVGSADAGSAYAIIVTSIIMLLVADGVRRGRRVAWVALLVLLGVSIVAQLTKPFDAGNVVVIVLDLALMAVAVAGHRAFRAAPEPRTLRRSVALVGVALVAVTLYSYAGFRALESSFDPPPAFGTAAREVLSRLVLTTTDDVRPTTTAAEWFLASIGIVWAVVVLGALATAVYSAKQTRFPATREQALDLLHTYGGGNTSWMTTWEGNTYWGVTGVDAYIAYRVIGSVCLVLGDPVGTDDACRSAINEFRRFCFRRGWVPAWYGVTGRFLDDYASHGWTALQVGEDTVIELGTLEFKGKSWQDVRTAINKAEREGIRLETIHLRDAPRAITDQLERISNEWASDKSLPEMGFTLGTLREAADPEVLMTIAVDDTRTVHGMTSWMPVYRDGEVKGWTVDIMRRRSDGFRNVMEFLIASSAVQFREEGYEFISLSAAPLARADRNNDEEQSLQKVLDLLADKMEPYYGFKSLLAFKSKFKPHFEPVYLVYPDVVALGSISKAIGQAYLPDFRPRDVRRMFDSSHS